MTVSIEIAQPLFAEAQVIADNLNLTVEQLAAIALERFIHSANTPKEMTSAIINQGDIYWLTIDDGSGEAAIPHPHVVVQDNLFNHSRIETVVTCGITSNLKRASLPGNVLLDAGEGGLAKASVVEVSKVSSIAKTHLGDYIGRLSEAQVSQILAGMRFLQAAYFKR